MGEEEGEEQKTGPFDFLDLALLNDLLLSVGGSRLLDTTGSSSSALALELEEENGENDADPVHAVTGDGTDGGDVAPAQDRVQESVSSGVGVVGVTIAQGPDIATGIVRTGILGIASNNLVPLVHLVGLDGLGKQTGGDQEQEAGRGNKEAVEGQATSSTVDQETDQGTCQQSSNSSQRNRLCLSFECNL